MGPVGFAMARRVHVAMTTQTSTSASKTKSLLAVAQPQDLHQVHQALQVGARKTVLRILAALATGKRASVAIVTPISTSVSKTRSQPVVAQAQGLLHSLGPSISALQARRHNVEALDQALHQFPVAVATVPLT